MPSRTSKKPNRRKQRKGCSWHTKHPNRLKNQFRRDWGKYSIWRLHLQINLKVKSRITVNAQVIMKEIEKNEVPDYAIDPIRVLGEGDGKEKV